jgi:hypothetical protein
MKRPHSPAIPLKADLATPMQESARSVKKAKVLGQTIALKSNREPQEVDKAQQRRIQELSRKLSRHSKQEALALECTLMDGL